MAGIGVAGAIGRVCVLHSPEQVQCAICGRRGHTNCWSNHILEWLSMYGYSKAGVLGRELSIKRRPKPGMWEVGVAIWRAGENAGSLQPTSHSEFWPRWNLPSSAYISRVFLLLFVRSRFLQGYDYYIIMFSVEINSHSAITTACVCELGQGGALNNRGPAEKGNTKG